MNEKISAGKGFVMALILTILLVVFSIITSAFKLTEIWAGYMFFWFFSSVRAFDRSKLLPDVINSLIGIGLGFLMFLCMKHYGTAIFELVVIITMLVILFFLVTKLIPYVVGDATFLFFTILTANIFLTGGNYVDIAVCYVCGVIFFSLTLTGLFALLSRKKESTEAKTE